MKVSELYRQVAQLGFEETLESGDRFYYTLNRALLQVNAIRPAISSYVINHRALKNLLSDSTLSPIERSEDLCFEATDAKSFYFEADGNGTLYIDRYIDGAWEIIGNNIGFKSTSKGRFEPVKGFIKKDGDEFVSGRVRLRFVGEYLYHLKNVAMYSHVYSDEENDIPAFGAFTSYDMRTLAGDFLSFDSPPIKADNDLVTLNQGYRIEGSSTVVLPNDAEGCYKVLYKRKPAAINFNEDPAEDDERDIDLDAELCEILPLLMAAYIWLEDEPEKAAFYLNLYRERAADIELRTNIPKPAIIRSANGW